MLVGIEVSAALTPRRSGVGNYTISLATELRRRHEATGAACFLYFANRDGQIAVERDGPMGAGTIYPYDRLPSRMLWMQAGLPRSIARTRPDVLHFPNHLAPLLGAHAAPMLLTIHDMSVYRCPEHHALKTVLTHRAIMPAAARAARLIIAVSERARQEILHYLKLPPDRVRVVHEGVGPRFRATAGAGEPPLDDLRQRYHLPERYILTVSTLEPRKNHARLIEAFQQLILPEHLPHDLVVVGAHGWKDRQLREQVVRSGLATRIHFLGYVADADLPALYRGADVFVFPSLYEGFGLPVLEAMACGVPCVISTDAALREVAGLGNAVAVDPYSPADIAAGLHRVLRDTALSGRLRANGLARAAAFSWQACADETYRLYHEVAERAAAPSHRGAGSGVGGRVWLPAGGAE